MGGGRENDKEREEKKIEERERKREEREGSLGGSYKHMTSWKCTVFQSFDLIGRGSLRSHPKQSQSM